MSLSALIKKGGLRSIATATPATFATDEPQQRLSVATVATVAVATAPDKAANDPAHAQDFGSGMSDTQADVLALTTDPDPDRHSWPHTTAMNTAEIDAFNARVHLFTRHGLDQTQAEGVADGLVIRGRGGDDRRLCLECRHLRGVGPYRCGNARAADVHADLARDLVLTLQRCHGYLDARLPIERMADAGQKHE